MNSSRLTIRSLAWFWRTEAAVVVGVAAAIAVLTGALLVGDSVRGSLRDLVLHRLGATDQVILSTGLMGEALAGRLEAHPDFDSRFDDVAPLFVAEGFVRLQVGTQEAGRVRVYGVDARFWAFHGIDDRVIGPEGRGAFLSPSLASDLGVAGGETVLVRLERPTDMPAESVYGQKEDLGQTVRATVGAILPPDLLGEFSLEATQGEIRAVFLPLALVQEELNIPGRINALLVAGDPGPEGTADLERLLVEAATLPDLGLQVRRLEGPGVLVLESDAGLVPDAVAEAALGAAADTGLDPQPVFTYLANTIAARGREIPYALITATDLAGSGPGTEPRAAETRPPIRLNSHAVADLGIAPGESITLEYYLWEEPGRLVVETSEFTFSGTVPIGTGDADLAPRYPGITDSPDLADWDPPFPVDLSRIRPVDEEYWDLYGTLPRAYIPLEIGQDLWRSRFGQLTSVRFTRSGATPGAEDLEALSADLLARIDPSGAGLMVAGIRAEGLDASRGAVNFSEYFVYFSFFLVVSALLLAALFFKLSVEQRAREIGLLRAVGYPPSAVRSLFVREGLVLATVGAILGTLGGVAYAALIMAALGTWWVGAVGTTALTLHVSGGSLAAGALGGVLAAVACIRLTLGALARIPERRLLAGEIAEEARTDRKPVTLRAGLGLIALSVILATAGLFGALPAAAGFFGAGTAILGGLLLLFLARSSRPVERVLDGTGFWPLGRLGLRNIRWRPARSVVAVAMIASATFILISVDAFRTDEIASRGPESGLGGYDLIVETLIPVVHDPQSAEGREALGIGAFGPAAVQPFRYRPGDDASCLNLYAPENPRVIAPTDAFLGEGRFRFSGSLAETEAERENPWLLLGRTFGDGAIPVIADANSITYVLDRKIGEDILLSEGGRTLRLRLVAALADSIFQGELLMSDENFRNAFPNRTGYSLFLVEGSGLADSLENALEDHGVRVTTTVERLAAFHRVENTYLSTFQALGALGLLLGTLGLGAVMMRNVLERRRELALMRALGYGRRDLVAMAMAESASVLLRGLVTGLLAALVAIAPALLEQGGRLPGALILGLLGGVLALGLITSLATTVIALRPPLLPALRSD